MFVLKALSRYILGNYEQKDLLVLPKGKLFRSKINSKKKEDELVCEACSLTLRRTEGEQRVFELYAEEADKLKWPLPQDFTKVFSGPSQITFQWTADSAGKEKSGFLYKFVVGSGPMVDMFHVTVAQCLFEMNTGKAFAEGDAELAPYLRTVGQDGLHSESGGEKVYASPQGSVQFYDFDANSGYFVPNGENPVRVRLARLKRDEGIRFRLSISDEVSQTVLHEQFVDPEATVHTDRSTASFIWCYFDNSKTDDFGNSSQLRTMSLKFADGLTLMAFSNAYGQAIYEHLNQEQLAQDSGDAKYLMDSFTNATDVVMGEPENEDHSEEDVDEESSVADRLVKNNNPDDDDQVNSNLVVGFKHDRSFVQRGNRLGIFKHTDDDGLQLVDEVRIGDKKRGFFTPSKMLLHNQDSSMLMLDPENRSAIHLMDLERGAVVEEWRVGEGTPVNSLVPDSKYAQMTSAPTLIGLNAKSIYRLDTRLPGDKRVQGSGKTYATKNDFSCGATTGAGHLAVASAKGEIRLFSQDLEKRAKTLLPMFGDAILGLDVTENGRLLLATCKNYLLLINTAVDDKNTGFTRGMGSDKPTPIRLQLKPEHVAYMGAQVAFTPARFSTGLAEERAIITSTGPFVITWNLRRIKLGHLFDYQIKRYEESVVADGFRYNADRSIVVTLPHHVTMVSKASLQSPTAKSLRRNVVDEHY